MSQKRFSDSIFQIRVSKNFWSWDHPLNTMPFFWIKISAVFITYSSKHLTPLLCWRHLWTTPGLIFFLLCNLHHPNSTIFDTKLDSFLNCVPVHFPRKNSHILDLETEMSYLKLPHMSMRARRIATRSAYYMCLYDSNGCGFSISIMYVQLFRILPNYVCTFFFVQYGRFQDMYIF